MELKPGPVAKHAVEARLVAEVVIDPNDRLIKPERAGRVDNIVVELAGGWVIRERVQRQDLPADCGDHIGRDHIKLPVVGKPIAGLTGSVRVGCRTTERIINSPLGSRPVWVIGGAQLVSKIRPEVHAAVGLWPHVGPGSAGENALRRRFAPSFKAEEKE